MKKVLIIEDNMDLCEIYKTLFQINGFEAKVSTDGFQGIMDAVEFKPDLVLLDIMMPNMNGIEFLETFRKNTSLDTPIVVLSNVTDEELLKKAIEGGARATLLKADYSGSALVEKVKEYLSL